MIGQRDRFGQDQVGDAPVRQDRARIHPIGSVGFLPVIAQGRAIDDLRLNTGVPCSGQQGLFQHARPCSAKQAMAHHQNRKQRAQTAHAATPVSGWRRTTCQTISCINAAV